MPRCTSSCQICKLKVLDQNEDEKNELFQANKDWSHITPRELELKDSTINRAGRGVFARMLVPGNTVVCNYEGIFVCAASLTPEEYDRNWYLWDTGYNSLLIDASDPSNSNFARYINHNKEDLVNLYAVRHVPNCLPVIAYVSKRDIQVGEELFVSYGDEYNNELRRMGFRSSTNVTTSFLQDYTPQGKTRQCSALSAQNNKSKGEQHPD